MTRRLYLSIVPSPEAVEHLADHLAGFQTFQRGDASLRWVPDRSWHVTTCFLGEVTEQEQRDVVGRLQVLSRTWSAFGAQLAGVGSFTDDRVGHPLWIDVQDEPPGALEEVAADCRGAARRAGLRVDDRRYHPHLTVARRVRGGAPLVDWFARLEFYRGPTFEVRELSLVESHLGAAGRRGPRHEVLARFPFRG